ncbi:hypothetical protein PU683_07080 [Kosakonia cowanii]|uniref:hypothetical protein n=1 Tax=Kosakonia cowanii TaxID=208223 RepID=UPI0023F9C58D|nr:hypothetical protein [Kosakonia cowanii]MDF7759293.1 hypothetical protein [Kosakonia cowanii]
MDDPSPWMLWRLLLPVFIAGCVHMVVVTCNMLPWLAVPLNARLFGSNKTWRGGVVVPLISTLVAPLCLADEVDNPWLLGAATGLGYMLGELPNSALKRGLGIAPGTLPVRRKGLFLFLDQADSGIGVALACGWALALDARQVLLLLVLFILSVPVIKLMLHSLGLKESRF